MMDELFDASDKSGLRTPALLAILDGVGIAPASDTNAVTCANAPFLHELFSDTTWPCRTLVASGIDVGLPKGQMGNSEVGHLNIGAGRIVDQELNRIDRAIADGSFFANEVLTDTFDSCAKSGATVHFMGLLSDGGVHSMLSHLKALLSMAADRGVKCLRVAAFLDGRDVLPDSGAGYVQRIAELCKTLEQTHVGLDARIGMISGRYYAMDRDNRWERVEQAWRTLVTPSANDVSVLPANVNPVQVVRDSYASNVFDEFVLPVAIGDGAVSDGDSIVFYNFRPDRAREITRSFINPQFSGFERPVFPHVNYICMTEYDPAFESDFNAKVIFPKSFPKNVLADYLSSLGLRQLHVAETEKYAHVTFFLNGGIEESKQDEQRILIPSPKVATYDLKPEMSAPQVTEALVEAISQDVADVYIVNYANGDMVGHTGNLNAAILAIEAVDRGLKQVIETVISKGGVALVTADHGNCEQMVDTDGKAWTAHTLSEVPLALIAEESSSGGCSKCDTESRSERNTDGSSASEKPKLDLDRSGVARLADIAPTLVDAIGLDIPHEWTGRSLLVRKDK